MDNREINKEGELFPIPEGNIMNQEITAELKEAYLDYAMSVIVSRALPDVRDGLKPVHRRILWSMKENGVTHSAKYRKSAYIVGEVLGKYHPHGDSSVYDAIARMAQDFSLRYPLVDGQGNWGSIDGDAPAAMRYTECRLQSVSDEILSDIEKNTVDWVPTYDNTRKEPKVLPTKIPTLLINGTDGIAVGMATKIPPHNMSEVLDATMQVIDNPKITSEELMETIKGPDFPTGGIIYNKEEIKNAYVTGRGKITTRGYATIEDKQIVITEIPYQVNKSELIVKIAELVTEKKIDGVKDIRDESDKDGLRIAIDLKNDAVPQKLLNQLWKYTDLQKDYHLNMLALVDGLRPQVLSIKDVLVHFIEHRRQVVVRRSEFDLEKARDRAHILEGLAKALDVIDQVIATIKKSANRDEAQKNLMKVFGLSERQATAILEMKLQTLAALERQKIDDELKEKHGIIKELTELLASVAKILALVKTELAEVKEKFGDRRRTRVQVGGVKQLSVEDLIPLEETVVTMSRDGYIKRLPPNTFKAQKRGGKGLIGSDVGDEDTLEHFFSAQTHDNILFFTKTGKVFQTKVYEIPEGSRTSKGRAVHNFLEIGSDDAISAMITYGNDKKDTISYLTMVTEHGVIKKTKIADFANVRRTGIIAITLKDNDVLRWVKMSNGKDEIILTTNEGQAIRFKESDVRPMGRTAGGVRAISLAKGDAVSSCDLVTPGSTSHFLVVMANGYAKRTTLDEYKVQNRGGKGILTARVTDKTGKVVSSHVITDEVELLAISERGQIIRTDLASIRETGRAAQGVMIMRLNKGDVVAGTVTL